MTLDLDDPIATLLVAVDALRAADIEAAVYGGLALAVYGEPRETKDADLAVVGVSAQSACEALRRAGLDADVAFDGVVFGGNRVSRVTLLPGDGITGLNTVDLVEPRSPRFAADAVARAITARLRGREVRILAPEDFVLFKILSTRERDIEDAATVIEKLGDRLDEALMRAEAAKLKLEISDHDIEGRLARVRGGARTPKH